MKIGICCDHTGVEYKAKLIKYLQSKGYEVLNFGTDTPDSCDYTDVAHPMATAIEKGELDRGIAFCGTGNGMAITLNHHPGIRAGLAWNVAVAHFVKEHNDAHILVMPARFVSYRMVVMMVREWLKTEFIGGRHKRRIDKVNVW